MTASARALSPRLLFHLLVLRPFLRLFFGLTVIGEENLRELDRFILAANHNSHLDAFLLLAALPARQIHRTHPVAAADHFSRNRLLYRTVEWLLNPVWITRGGTAIRALAGMRECLASGGNLILFPEGTRGEPGRLQAFKGGLGMVAGDHPELPIVAAWISGPEKSLPRRAFLPVPVWNTLVIGPPQIYRGDRSGITEAVRQEIHRLAGGIGGAASPRREEALTLAVLGIDGSGKSTLARSLAQTLSSKGRTCLVSDRLEVYEEGAEAGFQPFPSERLRRAVGDRARKATSLKGYKIPKLAEILLRDHLLKEARRWYRPDLVILDGSPLLNLAAWAGLYRQEPLSPSECGAALRILTTGGAGVPSRDPVFSRFPELAALASVGLANFDLPDAAILLDLDPALSMERIRGRGQEVQAHESTERLARLREGYRTVGATLRDDLGLPFARLDGEAGADRVLEQAAGFLHEIRGSPAGGNQERQGTAKDPEPSEP